MEREAPPVADALLPLVGAALVGGLLGSGDPAHALASAGGGIAVLALARRASGRGRVVARASALGLLVGACAAGTRAAPLPADHLARRVGHAVAAVEGVIVASERDRERQRLTVQSEQLRDVGGATAVHGLLGVTIAHARDDWPVGARVRVVGRLRRPRSFGNPGGYDYAASLARTGILVTCFLWDERGITQRAPPPPGLSTSLARMRAAAWRRITAVASGPVAGFLGAVVLGAPGALDEGTWRTLARTGLAHVASVSGFHIAVVAGASLFVLRWTVCRLAWVLLWSDARKLTAVAALVPVLLYGGIAGGQVPATRSLLMFGTLVAALLLDRPTDGMRALAVAAGLLVVATPDVAADVSFELSFASVAALVLAARRSGGGAHRAPRLLRRLVLEPVRVTLAATLATAPLTAWHFQQVSLIAPLANVVALPLLGPATLLPALAALPLVTVLPCVADLLFGLAARAAGLGLAIAAALARLPGVSVTTPTPSLPEIALCYAALAIPFVPSVRAAGGGEGARRDEDGAGEGAGTRPPEDGPGGSVDARPPESAGGGIRRPRRWLVAAVVVGVLLDVGFWTYERLLNPTLRVTFLSVGQGDAAVAELPGGGVMVVDGGGLPGEFDPGERIIAPFLRTRKIAHIDVLVLSHPELDHYGGLAYLVEHFRPREFWWNGTRAAGVHFLHLEQALARAGTRRVVVGAGVAPRTFGGVRVEVLHPAAAIGLDANDASLVVRLVHGAVSVLFTGDLEARGERLLLARSTALASTVFKVPHHGSATSTTTALLRAVAPRVAVISAGYENRFGFPAPAVVARLAAIGALTCRTDRDGAVRIVSSGTRLWARSWSGVCATVLDLKSRDRFGSSAGSRKPPDEEAEWREGVS